MNNLRFVMAAIALFATAFVGVSWASKSVPMLALRSTTTHVEMPTPPHPERINPPAQEPPGVYGRDQLARTAVQAANDFVRTPCDLAAKAAFIVAASTYLRAKAAGSQAATQADSRVQHAIKTAIEAGGLNSDEFPPGLMWSPPPAGGTPLRCADTAVLQR
jgi:hypothetical protein